MSVFILKLIAMLAMLLDHVAEVFGWTGWDVLPVNASIIRCIGRISFPVFAFFIVNGWKYTRNREKYFLRLALCGIVSHIPFTLAFYHLTEISFMKVRRYLHFDLCLCH